MLLPSSSCRSWDILDFKDGDIVAVDYLLDGGKMNTFIMKFKGLSVAPLFRSPLLSSWIFKNTDVIY